MMSRLLLVTGMLLGSVLSPHPVYAYVMPEEVLDDTDYSARFFNPPPSARETQAIAEKQRLESARRREAEQAAIMPQSEPEEDMHNAAPEEGSISENDIQRLIDALENKQEEGADLTTDEIRDQRILERIKAQREAAEREAYYNMLLGSAGDALHSGAPLADTGPATAMITLVIAGAIGETWRRVRKAEHAGL